MIIIIVLGFLILLAHSDINDRKRLALEHAKRENYKKYLNLALTIQIQNFQQEADALKEMLRPIEINELLR